MVSFYFSLVFFSYDTSFITPISTFYELFVFLYTFLNRKKTPIGVLFIGFVKLWNRAAGFPPLALVLL
nr:MAG TPA: hypothetical protein [Caudoviricetes sp.]